VLANPKAVREKSPRAKTDKVDAKTLARLLAVGFLDEVWTPDEARGAKDPASRDELLEHCRLAALRGNAEALLTYGEGAKVDPDVVLPLRVVRRGEEYWAEISASGA